MGFLDVFRKETKIIEERAVSVVSNVKAFLAPKRAVETWGIHPGMKVADFGAGAGSFALEFSQMVGPAGRVYCVDVQKELLKRIRNDAQALGFRNIDIIWADLEAPQATKLESNVLNFVLISNLLFQVEDRAAVVREAARVVREGGRVAIIDWKDSYKGMGPMQKDVIDERAARKLAEDAGLSFSRELNVGTHHWGFLCTKETP